MAIDFTVIKAVRQRFGDETPDLGEIPVEQQAPFVGSSKDFPFSCPNVDRGQVAVLQFESLGVSAGMRDGPRNILRINGADVSGSITPGPRLRVQGENLPLWKTHSLLVAANVLKQENVLHVESIPIPFAHEEKLDNFMIDNIIVFYKTLGPSGPGGTDVAPV